MKPISFKRHRFPPAAIRQAVWLAQLLGYRIAFFILGGFALGSLALWIGFAGLLRAACGGTDKNEPANVG